MARELNEYSAKVVSDHPGRFGFYATLTLPDVDGALAEAVYALHTLQADGCSAAIRMVVSGDQDEVCRGRPEGGRSPTVG